MAKKFGVFATQGQVIEAVTQLEEAGLTPGEFMVLAKDSEHSRRIESETDIEAEDMRELHRTLYEGGDGLSEGGVLRDGYGVATIAAGGANGTAGVAGAPLAGSLLPVGGLFTLGSGAHDGGAYRALGLDTQESELCRRNIESGSFVVVVKSDESKSLLDKDGGPDLSKLGNAEAIFRSCGASAIANGS